MKIQKTYVGFTSSVDVGRFGFFIEADEQGVLLDNDEIGKQAIHFSRVVFAGYEPFVQREDVAKIIKYVKKHNPNATIEINTKGLVRPINIVNFDGLIYNVHVQLKNSYIDYEERIKPTILNWFNELESNFVFEVCNEDDIDEAHTLIQEFGINKSQVFLKPKEDCDNMYETMSTIIKQCKYLGYNFTASVEHNILKGE